MHLCRKNKQQGTIRLESTQGLLMQQATYMMFKNTNYENKWFYAFVTDVTWVNNVTWEVSFILDVMQTYYFDFTYSQCLIERQHVEDDSIGANLIEENLEIGEYVYEGGVGIREFQQTHTCVATTLSQDGYEWDPENKKTKIQQLLLMVLIMDVRYINFLIKISLEGLLEMLMKVV